MPREVSAALEALADAMLRRNRFAPEAEPSDPEEPPAQGAVTKDADPDGAGEPDSGKPPKRLRKRGRAVALLTVLALATPSSPAFAADGDLVPGFANNGIAVFDNGAGDQRAVEILVNGDDEPFLVGTEEDAVIVTKLGQDGYVDKTFGEEGFWVLDGPLDLGEPFESASALAGSFDLDGNIVFAGEFRDGSVSSMLVGRVTSAGELDPRFGSQGLVVVEVGGEAIATDVVVDEFGRVVVTGVRLAAGTIDIVAVRLLPSGLVDPTFGLNGIATVPGMTLDQLGLSPVLAVDSEGGVLLAGIATDSSADSDTDFALMRLHEDGELDTGFGVVVTDLGAGNNDFVAGIDIAPDGDIVVVGFSEFTDGNLFDRQEIAIVRHRRTGVRDAAFSTDGRLLSPLTDISGAMALNIDVAGRITVTGGGFDGTAQVVLTARYLADGSLDTGFSDDGWVVTEIQGSESALASGLATTANGDIIVAGYAEFNGDEDFLAIRYESAHDPVPRAPIEFIDDDGSTFEAEIEALAAAGITLGCNPPANDRFCPADLVTRGQMAAFLVRGLGYLDDGGGDLFSDDDGSVFESDIDKLGTAGVTNGCEIGRFCPNDPVTRGQMAAFLVRALGYTDDGGGDLFSDDDGSVFESDIDKLGAAGVTMGCDVGHRFCPNDPVTRGQMAAFLARALDL